MAEENTITTVFRADISQFSASTQQLNQYVRNVNSQFEVATAGMRKWSDNTDGLQAKINQLNGVLEAEKKKLALMVDRYNEMEKAGKGNTKEAENLKIAINKQIAVIKNTEKQTEDYTAALKELDDAGVKTKKELKELTDAQEEQGKSAGNVAGKIAKGLVAGLAAITTAAVGAGAAMFGMAKSVSGAGDEIDKASQKLGISAESYQKLSYAMERSGADIEDISKGMKTITTELANFENGVEGAGESFDKLGVSMTNADGSMKSAEQVMFDSIDALAKMENATQRNALAQEIFGRSSDELLPLLNSGADGIKQLMQEAEDYGMIMSNDAVAASATFEDSLTRLQGVIGGAKNNLMGALLPSLTSVTEGFTDLIAGVQGANVKIQKGVKDLVKKITTIVPKAVEVIGNIASAVLESAPSIITALVDGLLSALPTLTSAILSTTPILLSTIATIVASVITAIGDMFPQIVSTVISVIPQIAQSLLQALPILTQALISFIPQILDAAIILFNAVIDAIPVLIQSLMVELPNIINTIIDQLITAFPQVLEGAITLLMAIVDALPTIINSLIKELPKVVITTVSTLLSRLPELINGAVQLFMGIVEAIPKMIPELIKQLPTIISSIISGLIEGIPQLITAGGQLLAGLFKGLLSPSVIWENIKKLGNSILDGVKSFFGINSPSKLFEDQIGKNLALGIGEGFDDEIDSVEKSMNKSMVKLIPNIENETASGSTTTVNNYNFDYKFEKIQTSRLALHKAEIETRRIVGGTI